MDVILCLLLTSELRTLHARGLTEDCGFAGGRRVLSAHEGTQVAIIDILDCREVSTRRASVKFVPRPGRYLPSREDIEKRCFAASTVTSGGSDD